VKNPIPDTSTARRWNLLSDASSSAAIKSLDRGLSHRSCRLPAAGRAPSAAAETIQLKQRATDLEMNAK
jgi:hypothetical protein